MWLRLNLCSVTVIPPSPWLCFCLWILNLTCSLSPLPPHTCLCLSPAHICPISLWVPVTGFLFFAVVHPKRQRNFQPLLPIFLQGMFGPRSVPRDRVGRRWPEALPRSLPLTRLSCLYRPSRMVPSITHGPSWLSWPPAEKGSQPAPRGELQHHPTHTHTLGCLPGALPGCWHPSSGHCLMCFPGPSGRGGEGKGEAAGEGERGRMGRSLHL